MTELARSDEQKILDTIVSLDAKRLRRSIALTALPLIAAVILVVTVSHMMNRLQAERTALESQKRSLGRTMEEVGHQLTGAVEAIYAIEALIESKQSYLRTIDEARFLIDVRMRFDSVHAALDSVTAVAPELKTVRPWRRWVTVVKSARRPSEVAGALNLLSCLGPQVKVATFSTPNGMLALAVLGDGSFTTAYRETIRLRDTGCVPGAYFANTEKWERLSGG